MWAGTCGEYVLQTWPDTVQEVQEVFDMISGNGIPIVGRRVRGAGSDSGVTIEMHLSGGSVARASNRTPYLPRSQEILSRSFQLSKPFVGYQPQFGVDVISQCFLVSNLIATSTVWREVCDCE